MISYLEQRYDSLDESLPHCKHVGGLFVGGPWVYGWSIRIISPGWISLDAIKCLNEIRIWTKRYLDDFVLKGKY